MSLRSILLLLTLLVPGGTNAQLTCTLSGAKDANDCMALTDGGDHCVWCALNARVATQDFGFCVSEPQAEAMEKNIPLLHCDRYSSTDDGVTPTDDDVAPPAADDDIAPPATDDVAPATDDVTPPATDDVTPPATDDNTPNTDDHAVPDDFWTCLQQKTLLNCTHAHCTWCDTKGGFGLCMTGPTAESASHSAWFKCHENKTVHEPMYDDDDDADMRPSIPLDMTCVDSFLENPTADECMTTIDSNGRPCQWCTIMDMATLCLSSDQASMSQDMGVSCENSYDEYNDEAAIVVPRVKNPYDPSCLLAYLEDSSESTCTATVDAGGTACEYCTLQGQVNLCLTAEQAAMGEQLGVTCGEQEEEEEENNVQAKDDPYDTACLLAFLQDPTKDGCTATVDEDGAPCEFCSLPGVTDLCLTNEQAAMGEQLGMTCDSGLLTNRMDDDPYDPSCLLAFVQDPSKDACVAAMDQDNHNCEFCNLQGAFTMCLTPDQAEMGEQFGITCDDSAVDVTFPDDFFECLEHYQDDDCRNSPCTWCNTQVGIGFCLAPAAAESTKQCTFFDCEFDKELNDEKNVDDIYDPLCLEAGIPVNPGDDTSAVCTTTNGSDGSPCVWCDAAGVFGLCLSSEQASAAGQYLQCEGSGNVVAL